MSKVPRIHGQGIVANAIKFLNGHSGMARVFMNVKNGCISFQLFNKPVDWKDYPDNDTVKNLYFTIYPLTVADIRYKAEQCLSDLGIAWDKKNYYYLRKDKNNGKQ